jgi:hypothetical protein
VKQPCYCKPSLVSTDVLHDFSLNRFVVLLKPGLKGRARTCSDSRTGIGFLRLVPRYGGSILGRTSQTLVTDQTLRHY